MKYLFFLLLVLLSFSSQAQLQGHRLIDSVLSELTRAQEDSDKIKIYNVLSFAYKSIDPNEGLKYGFQQLALSEKINSKKAISSAYNVIGLNYQYKSDYPKALEYYNKAMASFGDNIHSLRYGNIISNIAVIYEALGKLDTALEYNFKSLDINIKLKDSFNIGGDYGNIGILYLQRKEYDKALEYDFKSLHIFEQLDDKSGIAHNYGNIGNVYKELRNYVKALEYDLKALALFQELGESGGVSINMGNIGVVYTEIAKELDSVRPPNVILPLGTKADFLANATDYLRKSIAQSKEIEQLDNIIEFDMALYEAYVMTGNYKLALDCYKEYTTLKDSVYSQENKLQIENLETERQLALKDKQIQIDKLQVVQKRNERIIYIIALGLLVVVVAVVLRKLLTQRKRNEELATEKMKHLDRIEKQKTVLGHIAYTHSHEVSGQVATILGLVDVFNTEDYTDPDNKTVIDGIAHTAVKLDGIVKDMIIQENLLNRNNPLQK